MQLISDDIDKILQEKGVDFIKNHTHALAENYTESDLINRELSIYYEGAREILRLWRNCFLSCSSPFCNSFFADVRTTGILGSCEKERIC